MTDQDRVFPGDGIAPLSEILSTLVDIGYTDYLSLELFKEDYKGRNEYETAFEGYKKIRDIIIRN